MTAGLETFAKVRALHDRTDSPGEKAAAASRMEALARGLGMTTSEAVSRLDREAARPTAGVDWGAFADAFWRAGAASAAADAPEAPSRRRGLPIYDPNKVESWRDVAEHCLQLDRIVPKACGGKFLTKAEREHLKAIARHRLPITNATAGWIETVLARCEAARTTWRDRGNAGVRPDRHATESDIEKAAEIVAAAKRREASKLDTAPKAAPEPSSRAEATADAFNGFFNRPEFAERRAEQDRQRQVRRAEILARYGSTEGVYAETDREAALRIACGPMTGRSDRDGNYTLDGWGMFGDREKVPARVRAAVSAAWPLPTTLTEAWAEFIAAEEHERDRQTMHDYEHFPELWSEVRRYVVEDLLDTLPAASVDDMLMRQSWLEHLNDRGFSRDIQRDAILLATLRADIERMGARLREQDADAVQTGQVQGDGETPPPSGSETAHNPAPVQTGHRLSTRAERRAAARTLLAQGLTDREIARRVGIARTTAGRPAQGRVVIARAKTAGLAPRRTSFRPCSVVAPS